MLTQNHACCPRQYTTAQCDVTVEHLEAGFADRGGGVGRKCMQRDAAAIGEGRVPAEHAVADVEQVGGGINCQGAANTARGRVGVQLHLQSLGFMGLKAPTGRSADPVREGFEYGAFSLCSIAGLHVTLLQSMPYFEFKA